MARRREQLPDMLEFDDKYICKREIQTPRQGIHDEVYRVILKGELNTSIEFRKAKARYEREVLAKRTKYSFEPAAILLPISIQHPENIKDHTLLEDEMTFLQQQDLVRQASNQQLSMERSEHEKQLYYHAAEIRKLPPTELEKEATTPVESDEVICLTDESLHNDLHLLWEEVTHHTENQPSTHHHENQPSTTTIAIPPSVIRTGATTLTVQGPKQGRRLADPTSRRSIKKKSFGSLRIRPQ